MITQEYLKSILYYDPDDGSFIRKISTCNSVKVGEIAGCINTIGYWVICVKSKSFLAHRLAFVYMTGSCPEFVDHINGVKHDNKWSNLREASKSQNNANRKSLKGSSSKYLGVCWDKSRNKWVSVITVNYKMINLGRYQNEIDAARAYDRAAKKHHGQYANLNFKGE